MSGTPSPICCFGPWVRCRQAYAFGLVGAGARSRKSPSRDRLVRLSFLCLSRFHRLSQCLSRRLSRFLPLILRLSLHWLRRYRRLEWMELPGRRRERLPGRPGRDLRLPPGPRS